jgi:NAD(P)-dependent dehydrogenase (short-subunit alcohol dehydrogenase family)
MRMKIADLFKVEGYGVAVTGGASGLGLAYGEALAENGARVTLIDMNAKALDEEVGRLRGLGYDVRGAVADVTDTKSLDAAVDGAAKTYGRLDVCFANAGIDSGPGYLAGWAGQRTRPEVGMLENYDDARWRKSIDVNLNGAFATMRAAARHMRPQKSGRIICTTSIAAVKTEPAVGASYMAAKAGLAMYVRCVAQELAPYNITVNAIGPGFFVTNIGGGHGKNPDVQATVAKVIPARRVGFPDDIKGLALFLASPASSYVTGQQILIDGGWTLGDAD